MQRYDAPFVHYVVPDLLSSAEHSAALDAYSGLEFHEKHTDLFHFFQTNELSTQKELGFLISKISAQISKVYKTQERTWFSVFASFYFKDNHLLCHDDLIENRKFAFSYYLDDFDTGELVLYDRSATREVKRINVAKNLLVIFEVSAISFHEVAVCAADGRKAITGWFNVEGCNAAATCNEMAFVPATAGVEQHALAIELSSDVVYVPDIGYDFSGSVEVEGPFYARKVERIRPDTAIAFGIAGLRLISADFYSFRTGDYVLANDAMNSIGSDVVDLWIIEAKGGASEREIIKYIGDDGAVATALPLVDGLFCVRRRSQKVVVERVREGFFAAHFIYRVL
jgi:hypothetical protein